jgi:hypothetical protein
MIAYAPEWRVRVLGGLGKSFVFVSVSPELSPSPTSPSASYGAPPDLHAVLASLYDGGFKCQFCETITPLQWTGPASAPPDAAACARILGPLLGPDAAPTTFGIEYKAHDHVKGQWKRGEWIEYFASRVSSQHTVDLRCAGY